MLRLTRRTLAVLPLLAGTLPAAAQTIPAGWRVSPAAASGVERAYEATAAPAGEFLRVEQGAPRSRGRASIGSWLAAAVAADPAPQGRWVTMPGRPTNVTANVMATVAREFEWGTDRRRGGRIYLGVADGEAEARVLTLSFSSAQVLRSAQGVAARELMRDLATQALRGRGGQGASVTASADGGDASGMAGSPAGDARAAAPSRTGFRAGGAIVPGRYTGQMVNDDGKVIVRYDVTLFANGEYAAPSGDNLLDSTGTYRYVAGSGRLDIDGKLQNSTYRPDEDFCLYGRDATGTPAIYVEDHYGIGTFRALLRRVSEPLRDPPSLVLAARKAAEAEAARYKFVTAPGAGLRDAQIEAVFYEWKQVYEIGGLQFKEYLYLLLRDGTVRNGLPVPPQDLDAAASRRAEPEAWGRWRRIGASYEFAFGSDRTFSRKQGNVVAPAPAGLSLLGRFEGNSSYQIPGGAGAWSNFGVTFSAGGRFEKFRTGGAGMSSGYGDTQITTAAVYDDDGAVAGATGATFSGGSSTRRPDKGDRRGTYRTDGYALILTYDNGSVERLPFAVDRTATGQVGGVWMGGFMLTPPKK